jgi:hypothetical protein
VGIRLKTLTQTAAGYTCELEGAMGCILVQDLVWMEDREDLKDILYSQAWAVLQGSFHCCLSLPGKVQLLTQ